MQNTEIAMRDAAKKLFADNKVDCVLGYRAGSLTGTARPFFARSTQDVEQLVFNRACTANLATFLPRLFEKPKRPPKDFALPRVGIVAKGCDGRSMIGLVKEKQAPRENLTIIAMPCAGMTDANGTTLRACAECVSPVAKDADIVIKGESRKPEDSPYDRIKEFEAKPSEERWAILVSELAKCIRCNACREACPNCYCKVCFADQNKPAWVIPGTVPSDTLVFHLGRIFHQAGRCVECDACVNACPMGIDLRLFTQRLASDVKELFGCVPGLTGETVPPLNTFSQDDSQRFITDPEEK